MSRKVAFFRFAAAFSLLGATVLGAGLATLFHDNQLWLPRARAFGIGVLLAVALVAIFSSAVEHLTSFTQFPVAYVLVGTSFILSIIAEWAAGQFALASKHLHMRVPNADDEEQDSMLPSETIEMTQLKTQPNAEDEDDMSVDEAQQLAENVATEYQRPAYQLQLRAAMTTTALCLHGFTGGVSIGANEHSSVQPLVADICSSILIGGALASLLITQRVELLPSISALAVVYPLGIMIGVFLHGSPWDLTVQGTLQSIACGALLYVLCVHSVRITFRDNTDGAWKFVCAGLGFAALTVASTRVDQDT